MKIKLYVRMVLDIHGMYLGLRHTYKLKINLIIHSTYIIRCNKNILYDTWGSFHIGSFFKCFWLKTSLSHLNPLHRTLRGPN